MVNKLMVAKLKLEQLDGGQAEDGQLGQADGGRARDECLPPANHKLGVGCLKVSLKI